MFCCINNCKTASRMGETHDIIRRDGKEADNEQCNSGNSENKVIGILFLMNTMMLLWRGCRYVLRICQLKQGKTLLNHLVLVGDHKSPQICNNIDL